MESCSVMNRKLISSVRRAFSQVVVIPFHEIFEPGRKTRPRFKMIRYKILQRFEVIVRGAMTVQDGVSISCSGRRHGRLRAVRRIQPPHLQSEKNPLGAVAEILSHLAMGPMQEVRWEVIDPLMALGAMLMKRSDDRITFRSIRSKVLVWLVCAVDQQRWRQASLVKATPGQRCHAQDVE